MSNALFILFVFSSLIHLDILIITEQISLCNIPNALQISLVMKIKHVI